MTVHLVNLTNPMMMKGPIREFIPSPPQEVTIRMPRGTRPGKVKFNSRLDYVPFRIKDDAAVVNRAAEAVRAIGREPNLRVTNGGLDANWMVKHGVPTITFGAGQNEIHTVKEFVDLVEFESGCRLALILATSG